MLCTLNGTCKQNCFRRHLHNRTRTGRVQRPNTKRVTCNGGGGGGGIINGAPRYNILSARVAVRHCSQRHTRRRDRHYSTHATFARRPFCSSGSAQPGDDDRDTGTRHASMDESTGREPRAATDGDADGPPEYVYKRQIVWFNTVGFLVLHLGAAYGLYLFLTSSMVLTMLWSELRRPSGSRHENPFRGLSNVLTPSPHVRDSTRETRCCALVTRVVGTRPISRRIVLRTK